jgi:phenylalanyl-tRNA synthetase beta chain
MFFQKGLIGAGHNALVEFGVVKKSILKHFGIKQEVFYADFNWAIIIKMISNKIKFTEIPKYPEVRRDLALLIDHNVTYDSIYSIAKQTEKNLLKKSIYLMFMKVICLTVKIICIKSYRTILKL